MFDTSHLFYSPMGQACFDHLKKNLVDAIRSDPTILFEITPGGKLRTICDNGAYSVKAKFVRKLFLDSGYIESMLPEERTGYQRWQTEDEYRQIWRALFTLLGQTEVPVELKKIREKFRQVNKGKIDKAKHKAKIAREQKAVEKAKNKFRFQKDLDQAKKQKTYTFHLPKDMVDKLLGGGMNSIRSAMLFMDLEKLGEDELIKMIKKDYGLIKYIPNPSERLQMAAIESNQLGLRNIHNPSEKMKQLHKMMWKV